MPKMVRLKLLGTWPAWTDRAKVGELLYDDGSAVRVLVHPSGLGPDGVRALKDEVRILGQLDHPTVLRAVHAAPVEDDAAFVHEFFEAASCARVLAVMRERNQHLPIRAVMDIAAALTSGLLHARDYLLEDGGTIALPALTPADVLIDASGRVKVTGFRVVRPGDFPSASGTSVGFVPPQGPATERADSYAVGAFLVTLLTGEPPSPTPSDASKHEAMVRRALIRVLARPGDTVPEAAIELMRACQAMSPGDRPDLQEVEARLVEIVGGLRSAGLRTWAPGSVPAILNWRTSLPAEAVTSALSTKSAPSWSARPRLESAEPEKTAWYRVAGSEPLGSDGTQAGLVAAGHVLPVVIEETSDSFPSVQILNDGTADTGGDEEPERTLDDVGPTEEEVETHTVAAAEPQPEAYEAATEPARFAEHEPPPPGAVRIGIPPQQDDDDEDFTAAGSRRWDGLSSWLASGFGIVVGAALFAGLAMIGAEVGTRWKAARTAGPPVTVAAEPPAPAPPVAPPVPSPAAPAEPVGEPIAGTEAPADVAVPTEPEPAPPSIEPEPMVATPNPEPVVTEHDPDVVEVRATTSEPSEPYEPAIATDTRTEPETIPVPIPAAPSTDPRADATTFRVEFQSGHPMVDRLSVRCHRGQGSGASPVVIEDAGRGPCKISATLGGETLVAAVALTGERSYTCFTDGQRACQ